MKSLAVIALSLSLLAALTLCCPGGSQPAPPEDTPDPEPEPSPTETSVMEEATPPPPVERLGVEARVVAVIDGDTIEVEMDGQVHTVRYLGIDCAELDSAMGIVAADINRALVEGRTVELERDVSDTDQYGRLLRYVYTGGMLVNAELVRLGYAHAILIDPDLAHADEFLRLEQEARLAGKGAWGLDETPAPVPPTAEAATATSVPPSPTPEPPAPTPLPPTPTAPPPAAANVVFNPDCCQFNSPGNDNYNKEEEWVCITNSGGQVANVTGWYLRDAYGWGYTFPEFTLAAGATVRVRTGCGTDSATDLCWCREGPYAVWGNDGDTAFLYDAQGDLVTEYTY